MVAHDYSVSLDKYSSFWDFLISRGYRVEGQRLDVKIFDGDKWCGNSAPWDRTLDSIRFSVDAESSLDAVFKSFLGL